MYIFDKQETNNQPGLEQTIVNQLTSEFKF